MASVVQVPDLCHVGALKDNGNGGDWTIVLQK